VCYIGGGRERERERGGMEGNENERKTEFLNFRMKLKN
jgi:hypothetical protein